jgi:glutathione reductase (NADPH)
MPGTHDLVVIGTGAAGATAAFACREAGWNVAIADARSFGGTCALRGCDPKKVLVGAEELVDWSRRFRTKEVVTGDLRIDWPGLMRFKTTFTAPVPKRNEEAYAEAGIVALHGIVRFLNPQTLRIGDEKVEAKHVLVASGAKPRKMAIPGEDLLTTSDEFLELMQLPSRLVMVGGGYISFEFAHIAARAGTRVTIVHKGERPLEKFDPDLVDRLVSATRDLGIEVRLNTAVDGLERRGGDLVVHTRTNDGEASTIETDAAVHGAGRVPDIDELDLATGNVAWTECGVTVNEYLQSVSNPSVYAAGDGAASAGLPLTPVASREGEIAAENLLKGNHRRAEYRGTPSIVFTTPSLASVGLSEAAARERDLLFHTNMGDTSDWYSSRRLAAAPSGYKVLIDDATGQILGAHVLGPGSEELINVFALVMQAGLTTSSLRNVIFGYPTAASDITYMI